MLKLEGSCRHKLNPISHDMLEGFSRLNLNRDISLAEDLHVALGNLNPSNGPSLWVAPVSQRHNRELQHLDRPRY